MVCPMCIYNIASGLPVVAGFIGSSVAIKAKTKDIVKTLNKSKKKPPSKSKP